MSTVVPFLALLLAAAFVAYHRMRLVTWTVIGAVLLGVCWFAGVNPTAVIVATAILALVSALVLLPFLRKPLITSPFQVPRQTMPKSGMEVASEPANGPVRPKQGTSVPAASRGR